MKGWKHGIAAMLLMLTLLLSACAGETVPDTPENSHTPEVAPPALSVELKNLLTVEQVGDAIGDAVGEPQMWEDDTWAHYTATDSATTVDISMDEVSRAVFDGLIGLYPHKTEAPHIGEVSWWSPDSKELLTYESGVMFSVQVHYADETDEDMLLMATRHLTAMLLDSALGV